MLSGLILAGGKSSRMGRDKAGLALPDGRTLLARQADILRAAGAATVSVSIRRDVETSLPGLTLVPDAIADAGPLAGIAAGLRAAPAGLVLVLAVDMPGMQAAHLRQLLELATEDRGVVPMQGGLYEPLAAIYPSTLAGSAEAALASGQRAVHAWVKSEAEQGRLLLWETPAEWSGALRSWNTPADVPPSLP
jgi:molybdopterin-guanine dinucleotide biosynthesis protein A